MHNLKFRLIKRSYSDNKDIVLFQRPFMISKRMKSSDGTGECQDQNTAMDRFSDLPDYIIHYILSFIPTIVSIRMSLLSKRWRHIWASVPTLEFYDRPPESFKRTEHKKFVSFAENYLEHRKHYSPFAGLLLTRFKLEMKHKFYGCYDPIDSWLSQCIQNTLEELDIHMTPYPKIRFYHLPEFVLQRARSLTVLKLEGLRLICLSSVSLPSLINLSLHNIQMDDKAMHNLLFGCPNMKNLLISSCDGVKDIQISSLNLKSFEIVGGSHTKILVEASSLVSFVCKSHVPYGKPRSMNLAACGRLTNLSLYAAVFNDKLLEDLVPKLSLLESLEIHECCGFNELKIYCQSLKRLYLRNARALLLGNALSTLNASIDTPNLLSFQYEGVVAPKFLLKAPNLEEPNIRFYDLVYNKEYFSNLVSFLENFHLCRSMRLQVSREKGLIFQKTTRKIRNPPLPSLKRLNICAIGLNVIDSVLGDALLWCAPSLEMLSVD